MAAHRRNDDDLVARLVAWHNRHPLARRITPAQVVSVGLVSFPYWADAPAMAATAVGAGAPPVLASADAPAPDGAAMLAEDDGPELIIGDDSELLAQPAAAPAAEAPLPVLNESVAVPSAVATAAGKLRERARALAAGGASPAPAAAAQRAPPQAEWDAPPGKARKGWRAAFDDDLLSPYPPREVARWSLRHGSSRRPGPAGAPVRELEPGLPPGAPGSPGGRRTRDTPGTAVARLWVYTAAIDAGAQRVRVLVSPLDTRRVLGPRITGRGRVALAGALTAGAAASVAGVAVVLSPGLARQPAGDVAVAAVAAASQVAAATQAPVAAAVPAASAAQAEPTPAAATAASVAATAPPAPAASRAPLPSPASHAPPASALRPASIAQRAASAPGASLARAHAPAIEPARPAPTAERRLPRVVPALDDAVRRAAREASEAARNERAAQLAAHAAGEGAAPAEPSTAAPSLAAAATTSPTAPAASPPVAAANRAPGTSARLLAEATRGSSAAAPAAPATAWAVSTRTLRTRFESEQMLAALRDVAYRNGHGNELKFEVMPTGDDWRAVGWPFGSRGDAERLRAALAARGVRTEVVQF